jgi:hypothetical protein
MTKSVLQTPVGQRGTPFKTSALTHNAEVGGSVSEQGEVYADFVKAELEAERKRREALDSRGVSVVTTSSGLATAVFALGALVTGQKNFVPDKVTVWSLLAGLALFAIAALCGMMANRTIPYEVTSPETLQEMRTGHWTDDEVDARNIVVYRNIHTITTLRSGNNRKAWWVTRALVFQLLAAAALLLAVGNALLGVY